MKKVQKMPCYIAGCYNQYQLKNAIDTMILDLLKNLDAGYDLNIDIVIEGVLNGITLETFNMLALNINKELKAQEKSYGARNIFEIPYNTSLNLIQSDPAKGCAGVFSNGLVHT